MVYLMKILRLHSIVSLKQILFPSKNNALFLLREIFFVCLAWRTLMQNCVYILKWFYIS